MLFSNIIEIYIVEWATLAIDVLFVQLIIGVIQMNWVELVKHVIAMEISM